MPKKKELSYFQRILLGTSLQFSFIGSILALGFVADYFPGANGQRIADILGCVISLCVTAVFTFILRWELKNGRFAPWNFYILKRNEHPITFCIALSQHLFAILASVGFSVYFLWRYLHLS